MTLTSARALPLPCLAGIYNFLGRNFKAADVTNDKEVTLLATYLVELSLVDYASLKVGFKRHGSQHKAAGGKPALCAWPKLQSHPCCATFILSCSVRPRRRPHLV